MTKEEQKHQLWQFNIGSKRLQEVTNVKYLGSNNKWQHKKRDEYCKKTRCN